MVFSNNEMAQSACHSSLDETSSDVKICGTDDPRTFRRSRFDEVEEYEQVGHVGSGGYGNCLLLQNRSNMTLRVCKIQKRSKSIPVPFEVEILRDILNDHPRIIRLHDAIMHANTAQLYFEFYPSGDLHKLMAHYVLNWLDFPESFIWHSFLQLSEGLAYIHHGYDRRQICDPTSTSECTVYQGEEKVWQPIIHGDIKPENIFLGPPTSDSQGYPSLVLGDFGLVTVDEKFVSGTWKWQPPELPATSKKADVWALGAVIHALAQDGRPPILPRPEYIAHQDWYRRPRARAPIPLLGKYSTELHDLVIHGTLEFDPVARYSSLEVLQCVVDEIEFGVASNMESEPLLGSKDLEKTYDENGVTENATEHSDESMQGVDPVSLQELDPKPYYDPMEGGDPVSLQALDLTPCYDPMDGGMEFATCTEGYERWCM